MQHYIDEFNHIKMQLPGMNLPQIQTWRTTALQHFIAQGFPTTQQEEWKYTRLDALTRSNFNSTTKKSHNLTTADIEAHLPQGLTSHRLVFVNGYYDAALSNITHLPPEVSCTNLATALTTHSAIANSLTATTAQSALIAMNQAFMHDGIYLEIAENCHLTTPIHLLFVTTAEADNQAFYPHNYIVAHANSQIKLLETYVATTPTRHFTNNLTTISLGQNAEMQHYKIQQESTKAFHISHTQVQQADASKFQSLLLALGSQLARNNIDVALAAPHAECYLYGLYLGREQQHLDQHTRIDHLKSHCTSKEIYRGVLDDKARGVFNGKVLVHKDAQKTIAEQSNKNLLLSKDAEADSKPQLEIYADDVKCTHGATVGQLDADALFFLQSRGIDTSAARSLLTYGFVNEVLQQENNLALQHYLQQLVKRHISI